MRTSMRPVREVTSPANISSPIMAPKQKTRREFAEIIREFENGEVANDANVSKETVKCWKAGRALPQLENAVQLALRNPKVMSWVLAKLNVRQMPEHLTPEVLTVMAAAFHQVSFQKNPDGDAAREAKAGLRK